MNEIVEFFVSPYRQTETFYIVLEFTAAALGILSVWFAKKENIWVYPTGILSTGIYVYLLSRWQMYGDLIINIYYTMMSIYGWYMWLKPVDKQHHRRHITRAGLKDWIVAGLIFLFTSVFVMTIYRHHRVVPDNLGLWESFDFFWEHLKRFTLEDLRKITPFLDTFTTGAAFSAMLLMAWKKWESWHLWIILNVVSVPLYFIKGYGFTGVQYFIFLILAVQGLREWKIRMENQAE